MDEVHAESHELLFSENTSVHNWFTWICYTFILKNKYLYVQPSNTGEKGLYTYWYLNSKI